MLDDALLAVGIVLLVAVVVVLAGIGVARTVPLPTFPSSSSPASSVPPASPTFSAPVPDLSR